MRVFSCITLFVSFVYTHGAWKSCERDWIKMGCFHDNYKVDADRVYPNELLNYRDPNNDHWNGVTIDWKNYPDSIHALACECAEKAREKGWQYFGLQFFGECWSGPSLAPDRDGYSSKCVGNNYKPCIDWKNTECIGNKSTNYIYKLKPKKITYNVPINGAWAGWSSWSSCSKMCNNGKRSRTRTCSDPAPLFGGRRCAGAAIDEEGCNQEPCEPTCESQMDIGFVLDGSTSVTRKNWDGTLKFVNRLSKMFKMGADHTKFGVIRFSNTPAIIFDFNDKQYWTRDNFERKVSTIRYRYGMTRTDLAIEMAENELMCAACGTRSAAHKALLVVTDGLPDPGSKSMKEVTAPLKREGVTIVAVGVGNIDRKVLTQIATDSNHVVILGSYTYLDDPINKLVKLLCHRGKQ